MGQDRLGLSWVLLLKQRRQLHHALGSLADRGLSIIARSLTWRRADGPEDSFMRSAPRLEQILGLGSINNGSLVGVEALLVRQLACTLELIELLAVVSVAAAEGLILPKLLLLEVF